MQDLHATESEAPFEGDPPPVQPQGRYSSTVRTECPRHLPDDTRCLIGHLVVRVDVLLIVCRSTPHGGPPDCNPAKLAHPIDLRAAAPCFQPAVNLGGFSCSFMSSLLSSPKGAASAAQPGGGNPERDLGPARRGRQPGTDQTAIRRRLFLHLHTASADSPSRLHMPASICVLAGYCSRRVSDHPTRRWLTWPGSCSCPPLFIIQGKTDAAARGMPLCSSLVH